MKAAVSTTGTVSVGAARRGADAGEQFVHSEGLGDVVVGAGVEGGDLVGLRLYDASSILGRILYYAVVLFTLSTAFGVFGRNPISDYLRAVIAYLPRVFAAVIILVVAAAIAAAVRSLVDNLLGGLSYGPSLATLASAAIIFLGVIAALNQLNVAENVVNALLYAVLAVIVGVVVAVGCGGIGPMAERWRALLARYDEEKPRLQRTASARGEQLKAQAQDAASQLGEDRRGDDGSHPLR